MQLNTTRLPSHLASTPDDHSPPAPPLPIPNRTVKRRRADDSTDCPCESRSLSGTHTAQRPGYHRGVVLCAARVACQGLRRVPLLFTTSDSVALVDAAFDESPAYLATIACVPATSALVAQLA